MTNDIKHTLTEISLTAEQVKNLQPHHFSNLLPMLDDDDLERLASSIKTNGFQEDGAIVVIKAQESSEFKILDGRNRLKASQKVAVEPFFKEYIGNDPLGYVCLQNIHRRHLTQSQRTLIASKMTNMKRGERTDLPQYCGKSISQEDAAKIMKVSESAIQTATRLQKNSVDEVDDAIAQGKITISQADKIAVYEPEKQRELVALDKKELRKVLCLKKPETAVSNAEIDDASDVVVDIKKVIVEPTEEEMKKIDAEMKHTGDLHKGKFILKAALAYIDHLERARDNVEVGELVTEQDEKDADVSYAMRLEEARMLIEDNTYSGQI